MCAECREGTRWPVKSPYPGLPLHTLPEFALQIRKGHGGHIREASSGPGQPVGAGHGAVLPAGGPGPEDPTRRERERGERLTVARDQAAHLPTSEASVPSPQSHPKAEGGQPGADGVGGLGQGGVQARLTQALAPPSEPCGWKTGGSNARAAVGTLCQTETAPHFLPPLHWASWHRLRLSPPGGGATSLRRNLPGA